MKRPIVLAFSLLVTLIAGFALVKTTDAQRQDTADSDTLKTLRQEYLHTLQLRVDAVESQHKSGKLPLPHLVSARIDLLDAELEFATTWKERVEILKRKVEHLRENESFCREGYKSGSQGLEDALLARAERLRAEIALVREQGREE